MITTRFASRFDLSTPVALAPMAKFADGRLACAVSRAGGLGIVGGGYCDSDWLRRELVHAGDARVGVGFITWRLAERPELLDIALQHNPAALFLSFGDPEPFAARIHEAGVPLFCQVCDLAEAARAIDVGAAVLVAQGGEAGGHGSGTRSTFTLVPEVGDLIAGRAPETLLLAAGGVADGRGLAAALSLGSDGAVVGSRLWASRESPAAAAAQARVLAAGSDDTARSGVYDVIRGYHWPRKYNARVLRNGFVGRWLGREDAIRADLAAVRDDYRKAVGADDFETADIHIGEDIGLIHDTPAVAEILTRMRDDAGAILSGLARDQV